MTPASRGTHRRPAWTRAARAAAAWLALTASAAAGGASESRPAPSARKALAERIRERAPASTAELYEELRIEGPGAAGDVADFALTPVKDEPSQAAANRKRVAALLLEIPPMALRVLRDGACDDAAARAQEVGLAILGRVGADAADLSRALQLALPTDGLTAVSADASASLSDALGRILARKPELIRPFGAQLRSSSPLLRTALVAGIGDARHPQATRVLTGVLGAWPELDVLILQQIGRRSGRLPIALLPSDASTLGRYLDASAADRRREAALALGRTETAPAIPQLLVKLSDESPAVRDAAHWALKAITGLQFKGDVKRWTEWYASEEAWWNGRGRDLVKTLSSQPPEKTAAVTRELAAHRAFREQVSTELVPLLDTAPWQSGRAAVLCVLASLRSARAVPLLVERLDAAEGTYRVELVAALKAITGESRGPEPGAWDDWRP